MEENFESSAIAMDIVTLHCMRSAFDHMQKHMEIIEQGFETVCNADKDFFKKKEALKQTVLSFKIICRDAIRALLPI